MRLELRGDRQQHTIICAQTAIDLFVQHRDETAAALLVTPFRTERGIVQNGVGFELRNDPRRCPAVDQQNESFPTPGKLLPKPVSLIEMVAGETSKAVMDADDFHEDPLR